MSPILIGLGGTATGLGLIVTGVLMALWRKHAATPAKAKSPPQQPSIATFAGKGEEEDGNPDLIPTTALTNHLTGELSHRFAISKFENKFLAVLPTSTYEFERKITESLSFPFFFLFLFIYFFFPPLLFYVQQHRRKITQYLIWLKFLLNLMKVLGLNEDRKYIESLNRDRGYFQGNCSRETRALHRFV